jgi:hypothetical protein
VKLTKDDGDAAYSAEMGRPGAYIFWIKQHLDIVGTYKADGDTCFLIPLSYDEVFSVNSRGATAPDFHSNFSNLYGKPCPLPCIEDATATGRLEVIRTKPISAGGAFAINYMVNPDGTEQTHRSRSTREEEKQGAPMGLYGDGDSLKAVAAATDREGTAEAQVKYPPITYGYRIRIEHCREFDPGLPTHVSRKPILVYDENGRERVLPAGLKSYHGTGKDPPPTPPTAEVPGSSYQQDLGGEDRTGIEEEFAVTRAGAGGVYGGLGGHLLANTEQAVESLAWFWSQSRSVGTAASRGGNVDRDVVADSHG